MMNNLEKYIKRNKAKHECKEENRNGVLKRN